MKHIEKLKKVKEAKINSSEKGFESRGNSLGI